ncbi:hypothetical protein PJI23_31500, partial [Mycobacterium kansasii]
HAGSDEAHACSAEAATGRSVAGSLLKEATTQWRSGGAFGHAELLGLDPGDGPTGLLLMLLMLLILLMLLMWCG